MGEASASADISAEKSRRSQLEPNDESKKVPKLHRLCQTVDRTLYWCKDRRGSGWPRKHGFASLRNTVQHSSTAILSNISVAKGIYIAKAYTSENFGITANAASHLDNLCSTVIVDLSL
jgi:hypothetical protein